MTSTTFAWRRLL